MHQGANTHATSPNGYVMLGTILVLIMMTVIGVAATNTTSTEVMMSGNYKRYKQTFFLADGGAEVGTEVIEQSVQAADWNASGETVGPGNVHVANGTFYMTTDNLDSSDIPSTSDRTVEVPAAANGTSPTCLKIGAGEAQPLPGSAVQMAAGYEGKGKGAGGGGAQKLFGIRSRHVGVRKAEAQLFVRWRHIIN